ncbi:hypothetical protein KDA08_05920, partial [Candidatus Saccharibacteria bacterium]|nr:hypothetical protein [Candidatus Saccharibacteria bacterium]
ELTDILKALAELSDDDKAALNEILKKKEQPEAPKKRGRRKSKPLNKFEQSPVFNQFKDDIAIDKKLSGKAERTPRRKAVKKISVACMKCGKVCEVEPSQVYYMSKTEYSFDCPKCQRGMSR